jgi:hypothetical protein
MMPPIAFATVQLGVVGGVEPAPAELLDRLGHLRFARS